MDKQYTLNHHFVVVEGSNAGLSKESKVELSIKEGVGKFSNQKLTCNTFDNSGSIQEIFDKVLLNLASTLLAARDLSKVDFTTTESELKQLINNSKYNVR